MKVKKILNNNVLIALNSNNQECVIIGKGIAFGKKPGNEIDVTYAVKVFKSSKSGLTKKLSSMVEDIPFEHIKVCNEIVYMAGTILGQVDDKIFLTIVDHISFAIERQQKGMVFNSPFLNIESLYPVEYDIGMRAIDIIQQRLDVRLPDNEATFIAFHFLNANGISMQNAKDGVQLINGVLEIVKQHFEIELNEDSNSYKRFITHLKFFSGRILAINKNVENYNGQDHTLSNLLSNLTEEADCVNKIAVYIENSYSHILSPDERSYLTIHIHSIIQKTN